MAEPFWEGLTLNGKPLHPGMRFKIGEAEYEFRPVVAEPTDAMKAKAREWRDDMRIKHGVLRAAAPSDDDVAALLVQSEAEGAKKERAAVVRWLRKIGGYRYLANAIEDGRMERDGFGDHLKGEGA